MRTVLCSWLAMLVLGMVFLPQARADEYNQATKFTFSQPVEVPGRILPAGTYWFRLLDSQANRSIVQIYNSDQSKVYATILAVSAWRDAPSGRTGLTFAERRHDRPEAVLSWYYPGQQIGAEFLYPSREEKHLQRDAQQELLLPQSDSHNATATVLVRHDR